jgi:tetratricopeptide (TPR) repeat protein
MARLKLSVDWDWDGAGASFERALELNPNLTRARMYYGQRYFMALRRRDDLALEQISEALARDPLSVDAMSAMQWVRYHRREYDAAIATSRELLELYPEETWAYACLGQSLVRKGRYDEGLAQLEKAVETAPNSGWLLGTLGWAYGISGRTDEAREVVSQLEEKARTGYVSPVAFAMALSGMGEKDEAIDWLEKAYAQHDNLIIWMRIPDFSDFLSDEPRYQALVPELGLDT